MTTQNEEDTNVTKDISSPQKKSFQKHQYVRSKKLMQSARLLPCQMCGVEDGTIVGAHSNWGGGKGKGVKCDDNLIASLCYSCHMEIDQGKGVKEEKKELWTQAHKKTIELLVSKGLYPQDIPLPESYYG
jgi:hypothetical protein